MAINADDLFRAAVNQCYRALMIKLHLLAADPQCHHSQQEIRNIIADTHNFANLACMPYHPTGFSQWEAVRLPDDSRIVVLVPAGAVPAKYTEQTQQHGDPL